MSVSDSDVKRVLKDDGLDVEKLSIFHKYENESVSLEKLRKKHGLGSWAVRIAYNNRFGGVVIQQQPGEGNRKHYHPDADENWVIMEGEWEWWIEGVGSQKVHKKIYNLIFQVFKYFWSPIFSVLRSNVKVIFFRFYKHFICIVKSTLFYCINPNYIICRK